MLQFWCEQDFMSSTSFRGIFLVILSQIVLTLNLLFNKKIKTRKIFLEGFYISLPPYKLFSHKLWKLLCHMKMKHGKIFFWITKCIIKRPIILKGSYRILSFLIFSPIGLKQKNWFRWGFCNFHFANHLGKHQIYGIFLIQKICIQFLKNKYIISDH